MYQRLNQKMKAITAFRQSLKISPNYEAASNLGALAFYDGDYREAADAFRQALSIDNRDHVVWGNLAASLGFIGQHSDSIDAYKEARKRGEEKLKVNPRDAALLMYLAGFSGALGSRDAALTYLRRSLAEAPDDSTLLFKGAVVYEFDLNRREDALLLLRKAVEHGYPWKEIDSSPSLSELRKDPRYAELRSHP
jgi:tetratricopeptide (TPR) repeat protein